MNSSLDKLVKNLSDEDLKYLVKEFSSKNVGLLKQKGAYPYECMNSFERSGKCFYRKCFLPENVFIVLQKMRKLVMMVKN